MENPYNLLARVELGKEGVEIPVDLSLYDGKFYMYWGPVPGLLLAALQPFPDHKRAGDFFLAFVFVIGIFLTQSLILQVLWRRHFNDFPRWMLSLAILVGGFLLPVALLRHGSDYARIYEAAIAGGQLFLMGGLLMVCIAIDKPSISTGMLAAVGCCWVFAIGSRHILIVPIGCMMVITTFWIMRTRVIFAAKLKQLMSLYLPLALGGAGLAWYNWARFDSITETGFSYAMAGVDLQEHAAELFSNSYIFQNLYNYLFHPPIFLPTFPFLGMLKGSETSILMFYTVPEFYYAQPLTGLLYVFPFAIFAGISLIVLLQGWFPGRPAKNSDGNLFLTWTTLNLSGATFSAFFLLTIFFWAGMRYVGDFLPSLIVLSVLGFWQGFRFLPRTRFVKNLYGFLGAALAAISILMSLLLVIFTNAALTELLIRQFPFLP